MRLALYEPEIPQNTGTLLRLAACLGVGVDLIEPFGFIWTDSKLKRAGMDYLDQVHIKRHTSWQAFCAQRVHETPPPRVVLLTPHTSTLYHEFTFAPHDILMLGRESDGVPDAVHAACEAHVRIPMKPGLRSMNVALAGALVLGEALRQTGQLPLERENP